MAAMRTTSATVHWDPSCAMRLQDAASLFAMLLFTPAAWAAGCSLNLKLGDKEPIVVVDNFLALPSDDQGLSLKPGDTVQASCPGSQLGLGKETVTIACEASGELQSADQKIVSENLVCQKTANSNIRDTGRLCGKKKGREVDLGFQIDQRWMPLISVCFNYKTATAIYAQHVLHGDLLAQTEKNVAQSFQVGNSSMYPRGASPIEVYKAASQKKRITQILGSSVALETSLLSRGHLAPSADFILNVYRRATYFYANAVPEWQIVNAGNWVRLENAIRKVASERNLKLNVTTGVHRVLTLEDETGVEREITLATNGNFPVPKFLWKVVVDSQSGQGIAFVAINNCYLDKVKLEDVICPNVCSATSWNPPEGQWRRLKSGYLYCCEVARLRAAVSTIPVIKVTGILEGPFKSTEP